MPAVPDPLRLVQLARNLDGEPFLGPGRDAARQRDDVLEARVAQRLSQPERTVAVGAVEDERPVPVGVEPRSEVAHRHVLGGDDPSRFELPVLADVDEQRRVGRPRGARGPAPGRSRGQARGHRACPKDNPGAYEPPSAHPGDRRRGDRARRRRDRGARGDHGERRGGRREEGDAARGCTAARSRPRRARRSRGAGAQARRAALLEKKRPRRPARSSRATSLRQRRIGAALAAWPDDSLAEVERLAREHPERLARPAPPRVREAVGGGQRRSERGLAEGCRGAAGLAVGATGGRRAATRASHRASRSSCPSFPPPAAIDGLSPPAAVRAISARRAAGRNAHAKLLYGLALQRLGHRISARRQYDAAARLDPRDPEAQVAAAVARFDKRRPAAAFSRLGPLTRRFPHAATVRFHLGLLLLWLSRAQPGSCAEAKRQLRQARAEEPNSSLSREAQRLLRSLEGVRGC